MAIGLAPLGSVLEVTGVSYLIVPTVPALVIGGPPLAVVTMTYFVLQVAPPHYPLRYHTLATR